MPPHLKKLVNQAHLEFGTHKQFVTHPEMELHLYVLIASDELQVNTVGQQTANTNADRPKPTCHHCKKPGHYRNQSRQLKRWKSQLRAPKKVLVLKTAAAITLVLLIITPTTTRATKTTIKRVVELKKQKNCSPTCETCRKTNHYTEKCYFRANASNRPPPLNKRPEGQNQVQHIDNQNKPKGSAQTKAQKKLELPGLHSGTAIDGTETQKSPPVPQIVRQQPPETYLVDIHRDSNTEAHEMESKTLPMKETSPQESGSDTETFPEKQNRKRQYNASMTLKKDNSKFKKRILTRQVITVEMSKFSLKTTTSQLGQRFVRDETANDPYMPLCSTIVPKRKKEMLYVPLVLRNGVTIDALIASGAYVTAKAQNEVDRIKQRAPRISSRSTILPIV